MGRPRKPKKDNPKPHEWWEFKLNTITGFKVHPWKQETRYMQQYNGGEK